MLLRALARQRPRLGVALLVAPVLLVVATDLSRRASRLAMLDARHVASYLAAVVESGALWGLLLHVAARRRGALRWIAAAVFVLLATLSMGVERYFYDQYATYLNLDATLFGTSLARSLFGQMRADERQILLALVPPALVAIALVALARLAVRPRRSRSRLSAPLAALMVPIVFLVPCSYSRAQGSTPDVIYFHAIGGLAKVLAQGGQKHVRPGLRHAGYVPALASRPARRRNVLLVLTESVRYDAVCVTREPGCRRTPFTDEAAPERLPLRQMRANDSTTAISVAVLWSGLGPNETRDAIHTAPLLFDFAHAAGWDSAYWTSQHLMFANAALFVRDLPVSHHCGATDLDPEAGIDTGANDELLTRRALRELPELREPWFAVVHYANTHFPYRVDPNDAPFQPSTESKAPDDNPAFQNFYRNAVHAQDRTIADLVRGVRAAPFGEHTVIVFTSDHGEAFREHGQLGHTGAVFDEEVHVPAWIDAPKGTLAPEERSSLEAAADRPTFHLDVTPTILDLLGVWDAPELARFEKRMLGTSLLRPARTDGIVPLTNCTSIWGCAFRNWGVMRGFMKLEAREWDFAWHCWNVESDPLEKHDLGAKACGDLVPAAVRLYGSIPKDSPEMPEQP